MMVPAETSYAIIMEEIKQCEEYSIKYKWNISSPVLGTNVFIVRMTSPLDMQEYQMEINYENYRRHPLLIEFEDPITKEKCKRAYPKCKGKNASFFHENPCICHPCNRKAYKELHGTWGALDGWSHHKDIGSLKDLRNILYAIYSRISNEEIYNGRMNG